MQCDYGALNYLPEPTGDASYLKEGLLEIPSMQLQQLRDPSNGTGGQANRPR